MPFEGQPELKGQDMKQNHNNHWPLQNVKNIGGIYFNY